MPKPLATLLNVIWLVLGGVWLALGYVVAGVIGCVLIVTIPAGIASFRMARYVLWPFGRIVVPKPGAGAGTAAMNIIWMIVAGWWLALLHIISALAQAVTIVGIANAVVSLKMIPISVMPFGKQIVSTTSNR
ncbi:YccF domain-containing protein [Propionibacterium freudenreichii]|nr:PF03733 domain protein [Propionibacterium freudenreichii]